MEELLQLLEQRFITNPSGVMTFTDKQLVEYDLTYDSISAIFKEASDSLVVQIVMKVEQTIEGIQVTWFPYVARRPAGKHRSQPKHG